MTVTSPQRSAQHGAQDRHDQGNTNTITDRQQLIPPGDLKSLSVHKPLLTRALCNIPILVTFSLGEGRADWVQSAVKTHLLH